ncbi:MAG: FKBP-type peptidyl-prolyl cis-trans isomerase [Dysgonomonas sp.]|nr:FKBP-type peptidyl-prolyl cis-trans isomerase [Dysgonomonas sp.]
MKKLLLFSLFACAILNPVATWAQKNKKAKKVEPAPLVLKTDADTISYAFGASLVKSGLNSYLLQMGVLSDTTAIIDSYSSKIENETDAAKLSSLEKELNFKIDSAKTANTKNIEEFLKGLIQTLNEDKDRTAYNAGISMGSQLASMKKSFSSELLGGEENFNMDAFLAAFTGSLRNEKLLIENAEEVMQDADQKARLARESKQAEELKAEYADQIAEGDKFMTENKAKEGVVTLPDGLQYKVITEGTGATPTDGDRVTVHYKGTLIDGTVFDSSLDRGEPATFGVNQVIKGWTEALKLMPVGSKWMLYIPYDLAYGTRNQGPIKPYSNLIFEVELLGIEE